MEEIKSKKGIDWIALAIVCFLNVHFFYILGKNIGVSISAGSIGFLTASICFVIAVVNFVHYSNRKFPLLLFFNIILFPIISIVQWQGHAMTWIRLLAFAVFPMLLFSFEFQPKKIIDYTCYFTPLTLFVQNDLFATEGSFGQMQMGYSYAVVHLCIACAFELIYYRKENRKNWYVKLCILIGAYLAIRLLFLAVRGTILTLATAVVMIYITNFNKDGTIKKQGIKKVIIFTVILLCAYNFTTILDLVEKAFQSIGLTLPSAVQKTIDAVQNRDLDHGRGDLRIFTKMCIRQRPLFGYGTQMFEFYNREYSYPHNCILQLLFENGIIGSFYIILNLFIGMFTTVFPRSEMEKDELLARQLVMLAALPMLFFSNEMWTTPAFWMFLVFTYNLKITRRAK